MVLVCNELHFPINYGFLRNVHTEMFIYLFFLFMLFGCSKNQASRQNAIAKCRKKKSTKMKKTMFS